MIWFTIALFVVSFLVTALLAPKPDIEDARAGSLDDVQFPRATEDAPIPLVLGRVRMNAPNTLWYGDFSTVAITEKVKTGLFSSKHVVVGHKYYLGLDLGLCLGPDVAMTEIFIDEESVWTGTTSSTVPTTGTISASQLFGGYKGGGGWTGGFRFYPGTFPQTENAYIEGIVGAGNSPGYGGMSHLVFENNYIGESNQLRKMGFILQKYTNDIGAPNSGKVGDDMNPMEALYQICIDPWVGLGIDPAQIDGANWLAVATTLHTEGNGCSVLVTTGQSGKQIMKEILRQIDAIMFQDPETGQLKIKLIRDDYDVGTILAFDEDDILKVRNFTKTAWEDVVAQVKVSFPQLNKESSAVAISQDMATAGMIGRMKTVNMSFPFCYEADLANEIASRERAQQSVPLFRMTLEMNRNAYTLRPGDVFKISWPEYGLSDLVMRVQKHDLGELLNNKIVVDCIQDAFAVGTVVFAAPVGSSWTAPVTTPSLIVTWEELNLPFFFARKLDYPVAATYAQPFMIPLKPNSSSSTYTHWGGIVSGTLDTADQVEVEYPATGTLAAAYDRETGQLTGLDATGFTIDGRDGTFVAGTDSAEVHSGDLGILYIDGEWLGFTGVTNNPTTAVVTNVYRGLFGSTVKDHALGTRVYQVTPEMYGYGYAGADVVGDNTGRTNWYFKLLDAVGGNVMDPASVTEETYTPGDEMRVPARPRNLQLDAVRTVREVIAADGDLDVTWSATDRESGTSYPTETAAAETPAETETYDVSVYIGGVYNAGLSTTSNATTTFTIPFSTLTPPVEELDCEVRVWAKKVNPDNPTDTFDYLSTGYASLSFTCNIVANKVLLSGDMQSGTDNILLSGDEQSGTDILDLSGDEA